MSVYIAKFVTLLNYATKFKEVKIREKVSTVLVSNGRREKQSEIRELPQNTGDLAALRVPLTVLTCRVLDKISRVISCKLSANQ